MKKMNWRTLIVTCVISLLPIVIGIALYDELPARMVVHWGSNNKPDGWADKKITVFGLPVFMAIIQAVTYIGTWKKVQGEHSTPKVIRLVRWIVPILSWFLYIYIIASALGSQFDPRMVGCLIFAAVFMVFGNYLPKIAYENRYVVNLPYRPKDEPGWRKYTRTFGVIMLLHGILVLLSIFFSTVVTTITILLMIIYIPVMLVYGWRLSR